MVTQGPTLATALTRTTHPVEDRHWQVASVSLDL
jgi:hypothetical protein